MTNYYAVLDSNSVPIAWYNDDVYPPNADGSMNDAIPDDVITVTEAQWLDCINNNGARQFVDGAPVPFTPTIVIGPDNVDAERNRRLYGGFIYAGVAYQTDSESIANILGAAQLAFMAIITGAKPGNLRWANPNADFVWIATNNSQVSMDAETVVSFAKEAATFRSQMIYMGRSIKNALAAGATIDIYADTSWGVDASSPTSTSLTDPSGAQSTTP